MWHFGGWTYVPVCKRKKSKDWSNSAIWIGCKMTFLLNAHARCPSRSIFLSSFPRRICCPVSDDHSLLSAVKDDVLFSQDTHGHVCTEPTLIDTHGGCFYLLSIFCKGKDSPAAIPQRGERRAEHCTLKPREISLGWTFCFSSQTSQQGRSLVHRSDIHDYVHLMASLSSPIFLQITPTGVSGNHLLNNSSAFSDHLRVCFGPNPRRYWNGWIASGNSPEGITLAVKQGLRILGSWW